MDGRPGAGVACPEEAGVMAGQQILTARMKTKVLYRTFSWQGDARELAARWTERKYAEYGKRVLSSSFTELQYSVTAWVVVAEGGENAEKKEI